MTDAIFGYMDYDPNLGGLPIGTPYMIQPLDIQLQYKKVFDIYCGSFAEKKGEFITLLRVYNGDYRRAVLSIEMTILNKETETMNELFANKLE